MFTFSVYITSITQAYFNLNNGNSHMFRVIDKGIILYVAKSESCTAILTAKNSFKN